LIEAGLNFQCRHERKLILRSFHITHIAGLILALFATAGLAQEHREQPAEHTTQVGIFSLLPADIVTEHSLKLSTEVMAYTATAGMLDEFGHTGERNAKIFYTAYIVKGGAVDRPLTFVFNGGPSLYVFEHHPDIHKRAAFEGDNGCNHPSNLSSNIDAAIKNGATGENACYQTRAKQAALSDKTFYFYGRRRCG
jgi:hypothetical protein